MKNNLTLEYALENELYYIDCVKYFRPNWSDEECDFYVWNKTCFPFSNEMFINQLNNQLNT